MKTTGLRVAAAGVVTALALLVSACLLTPGKFASTLDLRKDGRFAFTYTGEIRMLALGKLASMADKDKGGDTPPDAEPCLDGNLKERPCRPDEAAAQKRSAEAARKSSAERKARETEQMKALLGGIDPSSPQAAEELAARLRRQAGWRSVVYKGDGLFVVDFALAGRLDHDFTFPTVERFPMANAFVQLTRRSDGTVRIDAPGFGASSGAGNPFAAMMAGMGGMEGKGAPALPQFDGTFILTTDGTVLANNTDEGPQADPAGQRLAWTINARQAAAPTALVRLAN